MAKFSWLAGLLAACAPAFALPGPRFWPAAQAGDAPAMQFPLYEPQKAVSHVTAGGGWFGREHTHLLTVPNNHLNAVGGGFVDLRVVMQGDGLDPQAYLYDVKQEDVVAAGVAEVAALVGKGYACLRI